MANIVLIQQDDGIFVPAVPNEVVPGQVFQWVRKGQLGPTLKALEKPAPIYDPCLGTIVDWTIEAEPV